MKKQYYVLTHMININFTSEPIYLRFHEVQVCWLQIP